MLQKLYKQRFASITIVVFIITLLMLAMMGMMKSNVLAQSSGPFVGNGLMVESIGRPTKQIPLGVYDEIAHKTYVVFPGCINQANPCSADPYITYYDHNIGAWMGKMRLGESGPGVPGDPIEGGRYDSHAYPQIVIDDKRYMHVFNSQHLGSPIQHYSTTQPIDAIDILSNTYWVMTPITITGKARASYAVAIKAESGIIYLFYCRTVKATNYSPFVYIKSTDYGASWSLPQDIIDPGDPLAGYDDGWNTIYVKGIYYQTAPERLHMVFGVHKDHNMKIDKLFYTYFSFTGTVGMYAPDGMYFGQTITPTAIRSNFHNIQIFSEGEITNAYRTAAIGINPNGNTVNIFHSASKNGIRTIDRLIWNGQGWDRVHLFQGENRYNVDPDEVRFLGPDNFELYVRKIGVAKSTLGESRIERWVSTVISGETSWKNYTIASRNVRDNKQFLGFVLVRNAHPSLKATYIEGQYTYWTNPTNGGALWAWSDHYYVYLPLCIRSAP